MIPDNCTLVVMSCDKYQTAWLPYFSLLKKYWPEHPKKIFLSAETAIFSFPGLTIECVHAEPGDTWSQRLKHCLEVASTDFIVFSLEDFFLQARVKHDRIETCCAYMEQHPEVAVCRLKTSTNPEQVLGKEIIPDFYLAGPDVDYRLETQFALWRRTALLGFIDEREDPWAFETKGSQRIKDTPYQFLWYCHPNGDKNLSDLIMPYTVGTETGYGINWGCWLWKNKKLFSDNGIECDFSKLPTMNKRQVAYKSLVRKAVYQKQGGLFYRVFALWYRLIQKIKRMKRNKKGE